LEDYKIFQNLLTLQTLQALVIEIERVFFVLHKQTSLVKSSTNYRIPNLKLFFYFLNCLKLQLKEEPKIGCSESEKLVFFKFFSLRAVCVSLCTRGGQAVVERGLLGTLVRVFSWV
jgi:hypothetical protein